MSEFSYLYIKSKVKSPCADLLNEIKQYLDNLSFVENDNGDDVFYVKDLKPTPLMEKASLQWAIAEDGVSRYSEPMYIYKVQTSINKDVLTAHFLVQPCTMNNINDSGICPTGIGDCEIKVQTAYLSIYNDEVDCRWTALKGTNADGPGDDDDVDYDNDLITDKWLFSVGYEPSARTVKTDDELIKEFSEAWELSDVESVEQLKKIVEERKENEDLPDFVENEKYVFIQEIPED